MLVLDRLTPFDQHGHPRRVAVDGADDDRDFESLLVVGRAEEGGVGDLRHETDLVLGDAVGQLADDVQADREFAGDLVLQEAHQPALGVEGVGDGVVDHRRPGAQGALLDVVGDGYLGVGSEPVVLALVGIGPEVDLHGVHVDDPAVVALEGDRAEDHLLSWLGEERLVVMERRDEPDFQKLLGELGVLLVRRGDIGLVRELSVQVVDGRCRHVDGDVGVGHFVRATSHQGQGRQGDQGKEQSHLSILFSPT